MQKFKDTIYELEGLVELSEQRPEKFRDFKHLIQARLDSLNRQWKTLAEPVSEPVAEVAETESEPEPEVIEYAPRPETSVIEPNLAPAAAVVPSRPAISLCVNDRFRFTRLLAGGDKNKFDGIMAHLAEMPDGEAAQEYLVDSLNLDPSDPDVADLIEVLNQYLN